MLEDPEACADCWRRHAITALAVWRNVRMVRILTSQMFRASALPYTLKIVSIKRSIVPLVLYYSTGLRAPETMELTHQGSAIHSLKGVCPRTLTVPL